VGGRYIPAHACPKRRFRGTVAGRKIKFERELLTNLHPSALIMITWHWPIVIVAFALPVAAGCLARAEERGTMAAAAPPNTTAPKLHFAAPTFDFGEIAAGTVVKHNYVFTNAGATPLTVTAVRPSCGCTTVGKWTARVEAGQTGVIPIQFNSAGFGGAIDKWIMVASNDPDQPKMLLVLKGRVRSPLTVSPANAVFTPVEGATASETKIIRITNNTEEPLMLSAPEITNRAFAVELKPVRPEKEFELRVTTVPPFGPGTVRAAITIKTNSSRLPVITVTALAVVQKPVTALPTTIPPRHGPRPSAN
jgi:hypothetical protein